MGRCRRQYPPKMSTSGKTIKELRAAAIAKLCEQIDGFVCHMDAETARGFNYAECSEKSDYVALLARAQQWCETKLAVVDASLASLERQKERLAASAARSEETILEHVLEESLLEDDLERVLQESADLYKAEELAAWASVGRQQRATAAESRLLSQQKRGTARSPLSKAYLEQRDAVILAAYRCS